MTIAPEIDYNLLRPMDCVLTAAKSLLADGIRAVSTGDIDEAFDYDIPNHSGLIVMMENRPWIVEALRDGLKINSLESYRQKWPDDRIVAVKRHPGFDDAAVREKANRFCIGVAFYPPAYDVAGILSFFGLTRGDARKLYCSEFCEIVANKSGLTWTDFPLVHLAGTAEARVSPFDIYTGKTSRLIPFTRPLRDDF